MQVLLKVINIYFHLIELNWLQLLKCKCIKISLNVLKKVIIIGMVDFQNETTTKQHVILVQTITKLRKSDPQIVKTPVCYILCVCGPMAS